jgi:hypothetical protein
VLTGRAIERLCRSKDPVMAGRLAVELNFGRVELKCPTAEQAMLLTGASIDAYTAARRTLR